MKKVITFVIIIGVLFVAWYLISPAFIDTVVDEPLIVNVDPINLSEEEAAVGKVDTPEDIIVGQDIIMDEPMVEVKSETSVEKRGTFQGTDNFHKGEGDLIVVQGGEETFIRFENFSVTNGPDLFVTLNKGVPTSSREFGEHIILEALKGNKGSQNYSLGDVDITEYDSVSIYCRNFSTLFATATL
ncbi:MAG: hypothetical protein ACJAV6_000048 [Candidatus Paceibacteria bacterium]|jgi:hypothetical protein